MTLSTLLGQTRPIGAAIGAQGARTPGLVLHPDGVSSRLTPHVVR